MNLLHWAFFELRYLFGRAPWDTGVSPPELLQFLDTHPPGRAVDIGCGSGTNSLTMTRHGWQTTGLDFSWGAVRRARRRAEQAGLSIEFRRGDVGMLRTIPGPMDLALDIGCYHALEPERRQPYARDLGRLVRPGGSFLLYGFLVPDEPAGNRGIGEHEVARRFGGLFELVVVARGTDRQRPSAWFSLRRTTG